MSDASQKNSMDGDFDFAAETLPDALQDDLKGLFGEEEIPVRDQERAIRSRLGFQLAQARRARRFGVRAKAGLAAAGILAAVGIGLQVREKTRPLTLDAKEAVVENSVAMRLAEDVDRNGIVNVLDALALAREARKSSVERSAEVAHSMDLNGDGVVSQSDVDLVMRRAVDLDGGPSERWKGR